jgi:DNA-binding transcriptional LysR family regulator
MSLLWTPAQLAVLAKVVDLNGFSAAARALSVPKAAVSRAVSDLESGLGVRVLERTTRRISLTPAGRLIYPHARRLVDESDAARNVIARMHAPSVGPLRVAADGVYGRVLLTPLVPRFLEAFPDTPLEVSLHAPLPGEPWDVQIRSGVPEDPELRYRVLGSPPAILCATPGYLQQRGVPLEPEQLRTHDLLTPDSAHSEYRLELSRGARRAEVPVSPKLRVSDPAVLHAATAAGLGIGVLPEFLCRQGLTTGRIQLVLPEWSLRCGAPLCAVYPASMEPDQRIARFVDFLAANVVPALGKA